MKIRDIMQPNPVITDPDAPVEAAAAVMRSNDLGALPVGKNDKLKGMVTDRDITINVTALGKAPTTPVKDAMADKVLYCRAEDSVESVAENMAEEGVRRLPVVDDDKRLIGIVSLGDIAARADAALAGRALCGLAQAG